MSKTFGQFPVSYPVRGGPRPLLPQIASRSEVANENMAVQPEVLRLTMTAERGDTPKCD